MKLATLLLLAASVALPQSRLDRYVVILSDPPIAAQTKARKELTGKAAADQRTALATRQAAVVATLQDRGVKVSGSMQVLLNALFIRATADQAADIAKLPGVRYVAVDAPVKRHLANALAVIKAAEAWTVISGGQQNAGAGVKVAILDTGIDHNHPAFRDSGLTPPAGYPLGDRAFTNGKVIVARSFVEDLVYAGSDNPEFWRADDLSPRDRVGHGTAAAMIAAGGSARGPAATITGVAPRAYLGNYKIFGSQGVNDVSFSSTIATALEAAVNDGMDIASISAGSPALWGPSDSGGACGNNPGVLCDWRVEAVENAIRAGLVVVASAGNDGDLGTATPYGSIHTPATAPSAISVGATSNRVQWFQSVTAGGRRFNALFGTGPRPGGPVTGRVIDVARVGNDEYACAPLATGSLNGAIALIKRGGNCYRDTKVYNAQNAGAVAVILYNETGESLFIMRDLSLTGIPAVLIGAVNGATLRTLANASAGVEASLDPAWASSSDTADVIPFFSSQGPSLGDNGLKPEIVAPGMNIYVATQNADPTGEMFEPSGFTVTQGTSFSAPLVAGAAALVQQQNPGMTPAQIKSAVVNTADSRVLELRSGGRTVDASIGAMGAGRLDVNEAVRTTVTAVPSTLSFGALTRVPLGGTTLTLANHHATRPVDLRLSVQPFGQDPAAIRLESSTVSIPPMGSRQVAVRLTATTVPAPGFYEGFVVIEGGPVQLRVPYLYVRGDNVPDSFLPLRGFDFVRHQGAPLTMTLRVVDRYGVGVSGARVQFRPVSGGGRIDTAISATDELGITEAKAFAGNQLGDQSFEAFIQGNSNENLRYLFSGRVRLRPSLAAITNAVNDVRVEDSGVSPGSYITLWGNGLAEAAQDLYTTFLPYSKLGVSVSFDVPGSRKSYAGRIRYAGPGQINVQVPWELAGETTAQVKVSLGESSSDGYPVRITPATPGMNEDRDPSGRVIARTDDAGGRPIRSDNPAVPGNVIVIWANGLGPVNDAPASGELTPASGALSRTLETPEVTIAGIPAQVQFAGLSPGSIGLYQLNVVVPPNTPSGFQPVVIRARGVTSKAAFLPVR